MCVAVLFLGGVSLDLWRAVEVRQDLAAMADSAANAGAGHIDVAHFRDTGEIILDDTLARTRAAATLAAHQDFDKTNGSPTITTAGAFLTVRLEGEVPLSLLRIFLGGGTLSVDATGVAQAIPAP